MTRIEELERELKIWKWLARSHSPGTRRRYRTAEALLFPEDAKRRADARRRTAKLRKVTLANGYAPAEVEMATRTLTKLAAG